jgi:predicted DNA-binding transcriptional regulator AlpA
MQTKSTAALAPKLKAIKDELPFKKRNAETRLTSIHMQQQEPLIGTEEAACYLGVSKRMLEALRVRGGGPIYVRLARNKVRYKISDINTWVAARRYENTSQVY